MKNNVKVQDDTQSLQSCVSGSVTASELRIGNLLMDFTSNDIFTVTESFYTLLDLNLDCSKPITIDVDSMNYLKINENRFYRNGSDCYSIDLGNSFEIRINFNNKKSKVLLFSGDEFGVKNVLELNCFYVHQLQNLFFALTGRELTDR